MTHIPGGLSSIHAAPCVLDGVPADTVQPSPLALSPAALTTAPYMQYDMTGTELLARVLVYRYVLVVPLPSHMMLVGQLVVPFCMLVTDIQLHSKSTRVYMLHAPL